MIICRCFVDGVRHSSPIIFVIIPGHFMGSVVPKNVAFQTFDPFYVTQGGVVPSCSDLNVLVYG